MPRDDRPIEAILKPSTIEALQAGRSAICELVLTRREPSRSPLLTEARDLTSEQLDALRGWLLDPASWYHAKKRCLPSSTAQFRISGDSGEVRVLVSMNCAGWIITAPAQYTGAFFDPVRDEVRGLLKALYPEFASPSRDSMWRSGTLSRLRTALAPDPAAE